MRHYNVHGQPTTREERARNRQNFTDRVFERILSPASSGVSSPSSSAVLSAVRSAARQRPVSAQPRLVCTPFSHERYYAAISAQINARRMRAQSAAAPASGGGGAKARLSVAGSAPVRRLSNTLPPAGEFLSLVTMAPPVASPSPDDSSTLVGESSDEDTSTCDSCSDDSCANIQEAVAGGSVASDVGDSAIPTVSSPLPPEATADVPTAKSARQAFGLKLAVADFSKKVLDNEGMNIDTFTYIDEAKPDADQARTLSTEQRHLFSEKFSRQAYHRYKRKIKKLTPGEKLRRAVKTIDLLLRACRTEREQTRTSMKNLMYMTFTDLQEEIEETATKDANAGQFFDVTRYRANKEIYLPEDAISTLRTHTSLRTPEMLDGALKAVNTVVEAFSEFPVDLQKSLIRVGWYENFGPKRVVIRQGQSAVNFYFILSGETEVKVSRQNKLTGETYGETVAHLRKGSSFGELALMYGGKRSATVQCKSECELLSVNREDFIDIFMNVNTDVEPDHIQFLRTIPLFEGWPIDLLPYDDPKTCMITYVRRHTVLCRDSNTSDWIYVVKSGSLRIMKDIPEMKPTLPKLKTKQRIIEDRPQKMTLQQSKYFDFLYEQVGTQAGINSVGLHREPTQSKQKSSQKVYIKLKELHQGEVVGFEPIIFPLFDEVLSVTVVSAGAECVVLSRQFVEKHITASMKKRLREQLQPYPSYDALVEKYQDHRDWQEYTNRFMEHAVHERQKFYDAFHY